MGEERSEVKTVATKRKPRGAVLRMPERTGADGAVELRPVDGAPTGRSYLLSVRHNGTNQLLVFGDHNAWRIFGMLGKALGIPLPDYIEHAIVYERPKRSGTPRV